MFWHNLKQLAIALDQTLNVIICCILNEPAWADITLSAQAYRWHRDGKRTTPMRVIDTLFFWQDSHCQLSYYSELRRLHAPPETREIT